MSGCTSWRTASSSTRFTRLVRRSRPRSTRPDPQVLRLGHRQPGHAVDDLGLLDDDVGRVLTVDQQAPLLGDRGAAEGMDAVRRERRDLTQDHRLGAALARHEHDAVPALQQAGDHPLGVLVRVALGVLGHEVLHRDEVVGHRHDARLEPAVTRGESERVEQGVGISTGVVRPFVDVGSEGHDGAQPRCPHHLLGVEQGPGHRWRLGLEIQQRRRATDILVQVVLLQLGRHHHRVGRSPGQVKLVDRVVDRLVLRHVEVGGRHHRVNVFGGGRADQEAAKQGPLCFRRRRQHVAAAHV